MTEMIGAHGSRTTIWNAMLSGWFITRKKSGHRNVLYDEAVEEALCFGWIDSLPRALDRQRSLLLFTPRKDKSVWSEANKNRVERLLTEGSMAEAGIRKVDIAKRNGSWDELNRSDRLELPGDLL